MAKCLNGVYAAEALSEALYPRAEKLKTFGVFPCLAIIRVGKQADDLAYELGALKRCESIGIEVRQFELPADVPQAQLLETVASVNDDPAIHGCLIFRPLPRHLDEKAVCAALSPKKDVDGITADSMAKVYSGSGEGYTPCTAQSCMELLKYYGIDVSGKRVAVIGRSLVIGRPVAMLLMRANATVTICHRKTLFLQDIVRGADIVVTAVGSAEAIGSDYFRKGQTVLDVGINWSKEKQKLVGDVDFEHVESVVDAITPVPAGIGSITTAVLCKHVIEAAEKVSQSFFC